MKPFFKRLLSLLLVFVMFISSLPTAKNKSNGAINLLRLKTKHNNTAVSCHGGGCAALAGPKATPGSAGGQKIASSEK